uniref:Uncharacterized protein n=1 Tax=viral metagenome TaxID=1070528 RepID=A0A6M3IJ47_9ZZZZ
MSAIHSIKRFKDLIFVTESSRAYWRDATTSGRFRYDQTVSADYTEVDTVGRVTLQTNGIQATSLDLDETVYVYKDYTAGYFSGDFTHHVDIFCTAASTTNMMFVWGISNTVGILNAQNDYIGVHIGKNGVNLEVSLEFVESGGAATTDSNSSLTIGIPYYLRIVRKEDIGTNGTVYCYIYDSIAYTNLVDTLKVTLGANTNFRYLYAMSVYSGAGGNSITALTDIFSISQYAIKGLTNALYWFQEYKDLLHMVNGTNRFFLDANGHLFNAYVANPTSAPTLTAAAGAGKEGVYKGYVSYLITWPGGQTYETGLSTGSAGVTTSGANLQINWSAIPVCPYEIPGGVGPATIHRKLYIGPGTGGNLGGIYYVATVSDNTSTTYTDNVTEAEVIANGICLVTDYITPPSDPKYIAYHYSRLHIIPTVYPHRLWYSEAPGGATATANENTIPLAFKTNNWDDLRAAGYGGKVDPQGLVSWGTNLYIPLKHTWIVRIGNVSDTWTYRKTAADIGISAPYTIDICSKLRGILGVSTAMGGVPGIALFNGENAAIITGPEFSYIFETDLNQDYIHLCRGKWDGKYYYLLYPSGVATDVNKMAVFDLSRYPDIRLAMWEDLSPRSIDVYNQGSEIYIGGSDGIVRYNSGTESINIDLHTHDLTGEKGAATVFKKLRFLRYALDSDDDNVTLEMTIDGTKKTWADGNTYQTISGSSDAIQYIELPQDFEGYKYSIRVYGTGYTTFKIYSPWEVEYEITR